MALLDRLLAALFGRRAIGAVEVGDTTASSAAPQPAPGRDADSHDMVDDTFDPDFDPGRVRHYHGWEARVITVEEAEAAHPGLADDPRAAEHPYIARPFGFLNPDWERLKAEMQPGDELWEFRSGRESWQHLAGRAGIALMRDGREVASLITMMS